MIDGTLLGPLHHTVGSPQKKARSASIVHNARGNAFLLRRWIVTVDVRVQHRSPLAIGSARRRACSRQRISEKRLSVLADGRSSTCSALPMYGLLSPKRAEAPPVAGPHPAESTRRAHQSRRMTGWLSPTTRATRDGSISVRRLSRVVANPQLPQLTCADAVRTESQPHRACGVPQRAVSTPVRNTETETELHRQRHRQRTNENIDTELLRPREPTQPRERTYDGWRSCIASSSSVRLPCLLSFRMLT